MPGSGRETDVKLVSVKYRDFAWKKTTTSSSDGATNEIFDGRRRQCRRERGEFQRAKRKETGAGNA
ncbi:hypothetical protein Bca52824_010771 [Brassica carinata]|uniref:Uncharacterized protein n=1 Tax=Brassica carinata TaxID=52824 RepID=A0A8X8BB61_BRACI|nr:hypothetical protein Bca52824_010771 [Brassica carinata]